MAMQRDYERAFNKSLLTFKNNPYFVSWQLLSHSDTFIVLCRCTILHFSCHFNEQNDKLQMDWQQFSEAQNHLAKYLYILTDPCFPGKGYLSINVAF